MDEQRPGDAERPRRKRRRRRAIRRWCLPPPWTREPGELLEGMFVLEELSSDLGLALWTAFRDVMLWAATPDERRPGLFTPGAEARRPRIDDELRLPPPLTPPLTTLATVVSHPGQVSEQVVSLSCLDVARWAREQRAMGTAVSFAQAASLAWPDAPAPALEVGRLLVAWGRLRRAETWLRRAIGLARRGKHWESYAEAYVELGALYVRRGVGETGERFYTQGLRAARRWGLTTVRGAAHHGLLLRALEAGDLEEAERHARGAMRAYGRGHPRLPELEHDEAYLWVRRENYARALTRLQKLLPTRVEPVERSLTLAILAHAAAGMGDVAQYEEYAMDAWTVIRRHPGEEGRHGRALLELARASVVARDWYHVEQAVRVASESVSPLTEGAVATQVADIAAMLRARRAKPKPSAEAE